MRRRVVYIVVRVWSVLSAVLECIEVADLNMQHVSFFVGAGVVLDVVGLVSGFSSRYCEIARAIQTTRLLYWRYCKSSASHVRSDIEVEASIVIDVIFRSMKREWGLLKTMWALKVLQQMACSFHKQYHYKRRMQFQR